MVQCSASVFWLGAYLKKGSMARMRTHYKPNDTGIIWDIWCKLKMLSTFTTPCQFHIYSYGKKSCVFVNKSSIHGPCSTANCCTVQMGSSQCERDVAAMSQLSIASDGCKCQIHSCDVANIIQLILHVITCGMQTGVCCAHGYSDWNLRNPLEDSSPSQAGGHKETCMTWMVHKGIWWSLCVTIITIS